MTQAETPFAPTIVAVYPNNTEAELAVKQLHEAGFALEDLSIVGRDFQETDKPVGFISLGKDAKAGAEAGAWYGGLFGVFIGAGFFVLPQLGLLVAAGPITMALLASIEGGAAGAALGSLAGALVGWGFPKDRALEYESHVKGGKFLVIVRSSPEIVARARILLGSNGSEHIKGFEPRST